MFSNKIHNHYSSFVDEDNDDNMEQCTLTINVDENGQLVENNQILNYWFRDDDLSNFNFHDFV